MRRQELRGGHVEFLQDGVTTAARDVAAQPLDGRAALVEVLLRVGRDLVPLAELGRWGGEKITLPVCRSVSVSCR